MISLPQGIGGVQRVRECLGNGEFAQLFNSCVEQMVSDGYAPSTLQTYVYGVTHFLYWIKHSGGTVSKIETLTVQQFIRNHLTRCRCGGRFACSRYNVRRALNVMLRALRRLGERVDLPAAPDSVEVELSAYDAYMTEVSGNTSNTRTAYLNVIRQFLSDVFGATEVSHAKFTPDAVRRFIGAMSKRHSRLTVVVPAMRSYLRFKAVAGVQVTALLAAIPKIAQWRLARLPKTLTSKEIAKLLKSFDRETEQGRRDYAIARCLTDLGLRAAETAQLRLDDIDWRTGVIKVQGKGQRVQMLPLTLEVGEALADYISKSRPKTSSRAVFMRLQAPIVPITTPAVSGAMRLAAQRCGLQDKMKGTHILRHSIAARLLNAGATLKGIADVLRHDSFDTTRIYTKVDLPALRRVAMPWVGRSV
jgi:site-specific recombinase XerD